MTVSSDCIFYIVVAVLNGTETLERCIKSVLNQDYLGWRLLLVDGGSDDGTLEIIKKYKEDLTWWISEPDQGVYDAWNKALPQVGSGWVVFLGADDTLRSHDVLSAAAKILKKHEDVAKVAYGRVAVVDSEGRTLTMKGDPWSVAGKNFTSVMTLPHQGVFHHSSLFEEYGPFDLRMKIAGDYEWLLRVLPRHPPLYLDNLVVASWQIGGLSYNVETPLIVAREFSMARKKNGFDFFSLSLLWFYCKAYVLYWLTLVFGQQGAARVAVIYRKFSGQWTSQ